MPCRNTVSFNAMISAFAKNNRLAAARRLFDQMPARNLLSWNSMLAAYCHHGRSLEALQLFQRMPSRDPFSFALMITCFSRKGMMDEAKKIFLQSRSSCCNSVVCYNAMIAGYAKNGRFEEAKLLLAAAPSPDMISWNSVLAGYTQREKMGAAASFFFKEMPERDAISWNLMVDGFLRGGEIAAAWDYFRRTPRRNIISWVTMVSGLARAGMVAHARELFDQMPEKNLAAWNAMISGHAQALQIHEAHQLFSQMPQRNAISWTAMISALASAGSLATARDLLRRMPFPGRRRRRRRDVVSWNAMIAGYARCGRMEEALQLFQSMPEKDVVSFNTMIAGFAQAGQPAQAAALFEQMGNERNTISWNSIIAGLTQNGLHHEALRKLISMLRAGERLDGSTLSCGLSACGNLAALFAGEQLHAAVVKFGFSGDASAGNALIAMYGKCGEIAAAERIFREMQAPDVVSCNSLISGLAMNGGGAAALELFWEMVGALKIPPDEATFVGVLSACNHAGLVEEGLQIFRSISGPSVEHFACVVDLLGRAGRVEEAYELVKKTMAAGGDMTATAGVWGALLAACRVHCRNPNLAGVAAGELADLEKNYYVGLSNVHAEEGRWEEAERVRRMMREKKVRKETGCSWIEVNGRCGLSPQVARDSTGWPDLGGARDVDRADQEDDGCNCGGGVDF
ncbi:unnamed protein product [Spirodela intermedia]|uniref:Uncharacterized protein n=1 Tax=Spirodela intermedia TaxID=51605 RepID=A0A7I8JEK5_SPIIN|nr:unnamed protein product [Spirodela intermedia]CAA6668576.1 unnamed protein product [Spirodela intermedia]